MTDDTHGGSVVACPRPLHRNFEVFGEAGHRGERIVLRESVVAGVEEERVESRFVDVGRQGKHERRVASPSVEHDHHGRSAFDGDPPCVKASVVHAREIHDLEGKPKVRWEDIDGRLRRRESAFQYPRRHSGCARDEDRGKR